MAQELKARLEADYKTAFKASNALVVETLRYLKAQVKNGEIARRKDFDDHEVLDVILTDAKRHRDAIEQFERGGRADLAEHERQQLAVLEVYLPAQLSDEELRDIIRELIAQTGAASPADLGKVMGVVMQKVRGQADGQKVRALVADELTKRSKTS